MVAVPKSADVLTRFRKLRGFLKGCFVSDYSRSRLIIGDHNLSYSNHTLTKVVDVNQSCMEDTGICGQEVLSIMTDQLPDYTAMTVRLHKSPERLFHLSFSLEDIYRGIRIADDERTFSLIWKKLYEGKFVVDPLYHRIGLGRLIMFNQLRLGYCFGLKACEIRAADENGMLTWPKMGFKLKNKAETEAFIHHCSFGFSFLKPYLDEETQQKYQEIIDGLDVNNPYCVWDVMKMIAPLNATPEQLEAAIVGWSMQENAYPATSMAKKTKATRFVDVLLYCEAFECSFDFNDAKQIRELERYCRRNFQTGKPLDFSQNGKLTFR